MCGIVGIADSSANSRYSREDVGRMAQTIRHRGPDDEGTYADGNVFIGMRRLSIIDLAGGHQPVHNEDRTIWVVNNGEIYNFRELREELAAKGYKFKTSSDTEVLVHLYEDLGESFLERLEGMFGLALWDGRKKQLLVARDRVGIKPVYLWRFPGGVAFASEVKAFCPLPGFSAELDQSALVDYLSIGYAVAPATVFQGVEKLPPASVMTWRNGQMAVRQYWQPPTSVDESLSYADWVDRVRGELRRAVRKHMVSDVPIGAFLSGGIDSSTVAALMSGEADSALNTYSIGYAGSKVADYYNELSYAKQMADLLGSNHREILVQPNVVELLPRLLWHLEEPISDSAISTTFLVSQLAAESVTVILSGVGGDELFAGYPRYLGDYLQRHYRRLPRWCRDQLLPRLARSLPSGRQNRFMDLARYAKRFIQAGQLDWRDRYAFFLAIADGDTVNALMRGPASRSVSGLRRVLEGVSGDDELLRLLHADWRTQLAENLLLLTDKMTMACSLECRVPFLDHQLFELAGRIPARHKLPGGQLKGLLKDCVRDILPASIVDRRKRGFGAPVGAWFKRELVDLRAELLGEATTVKRGWFDPKVVSAICSDHDNNRTDYTDILFTLMNLEIWSRLFLDGMSHEDVTEELLDRVQWAA